MSEAVEADMLEERGLSVSPFHARCVHAFRASVERYGAAKVTEYGTPAAHAETRIKSDLYAADLDALHVEAQWMRAWAFTSSRSAMAARRPVLMRLAEQMELP